MADAPYPPPHHRNEALDHGWARVPGEEPHLIDTLESEKHPGHADAAVPLAAKGDVVVVENTRSRRAHAQCDGWKQWCCRRRKQRGQQ